MFIIRNERIALKKPQTNRHEHLLLKTGKRAEWKSNDKNRTLHILCNICMNRARWKNERTERACNRNINCVCHFTFYDRDAKQCFDMMTEMHTHAHVHILFVYELRMINNSGCICICAYELLKWYKILCCVHSTVRSAYTLHLMRHSRNSSENYLHVFMVYKWQSEHNTCVSNVSIWAFRRYYNMEYKVFFIQ